MKTYGGVGV